MTLETGGLDSQIKQRMDAYRGNPQQLQKRYGANKELLDLLALQKLTSEKKAAAQDMQMKMQQQPGTIAQQREQEALALTKQEMGGTLKDLTSRTKGTLDQKQRMQQKNMRRMAQGRPRPTGIAGLPGLSGMRPQPKRVMTPNPNMGGLPATPKAQSLRLAAGGIVPFQAGTDVNTRKSLIEAELNRLGLSAQDLQRDPILTNEVLNIIQDKAALKTGLIKGTVDPGGYFSLYQKYIGGPFADFVGESRFGRAIGMGDPIGMGPKEERKTIGEKISATNPFSDNPLTKTELLSIAAALPTQTETPDQTTDTDTDTTASEEPIAGNITFLPAERENFFEGIDTEYTPKVAEKPSEAALQDAIGKATAQAGKVPTRKAVDAPEVAPLTAVDPAYSAANQKLFDELTERYVSDSNVDVDAAIEAARADSDAYMGRADKAKIYADQEAEERALQAETLDPAKLEKLARIQTLAGGRQGAGGIGAAYVASELGKDKRRSEGLTTLRGIQDTGVSTDLDIAKTGSSRGSEAGSRAEARRAAGMSGIQGRIDDAEARALQNQQLQTQANIEMFKYKDSVSKGNFDAAREALDREGALLNSVIRSEVADISNQTKLNISEAEETNKAKKQAIENEIEIAKKRSDEALEINKALFNNEIELLKMLETRAKNVNEMIQAALVTDPLAMELRGRLSELAGSENDPEYRKLEAQIKKLELATIQELSRRYGVFTSAYGDMLSLYQRVQQIRAQNTMLPGMSTLLSPDDVIDMVEE